MVEEKRRNTTACVNSRVNEERSAIANVDQGKTKEFQEVIEKKKEITGVTKEKLEHPVSNILFFVP